MHGTRARVRKAWPAVAAAGVLASAWLGCARPEPPELALRRLLDTERDFSRAAVAYGMKVAFLRYLADDSIVFRPDPVNGKRYTAARPDPGIELSWEPVRAGVSRAGDLGWTTGPYRVAASEGEDELLGYFVSVWKLQPTERWKVVVDLGTEDPQGDPCEEKAELDLLPGASPAAGGTPDPDALRRFDAELAGRARSDGLARALAPVLDDEPRFYRDGRCPIVGREAVLALLRSAPPEVFWEPIDAWVSASADLAYSYGSYERLADDADAPEGGRGYYVRIWRRGADGDAGWRLLVDVTSPVPAEPAGGADDPPPAG